MARKTNRPAGDDGKAAQGASPARKRRDPDSLPAVPDSKALIGADYVATRWLYVDPKQREHWHEREPIDVPVMPIKFVRLDGVVWQVVARHRVKLHNRFNTELFPLPHGRAWQYAGPGYIAAIYARPASHYLLKKLKVKP